MTTTSPDWADEKAAEIAQQHFGSNRQIQASVLADDIGQALREAYERGVTDAAKIVEAQDGMQGWKRRVAVMIRALPSSRD